jgi:CheY-like chemotaxis protein
VQIVVSDTGAGIKPEFLPHLFERFRQADSGFARERGGLGLGLALSRQLVEMHGGTITGASDGEGQGATFVVRLPVMIASVTWRAEAEPQPPQPLPSAPPLSALIGVRVLAVDDDPDALLLLSEILAATGAEVLTARSAAAALERLVVEPPPHVIVSDIGMPGLDGFEFIRRVRQSPQPEVRALPAVALTAYARSEDRTQALESGYQMHLAKPISPQELSAAIRALTQGA